MPPQASPDKALQAILPLIASGQAYEAHQKARTFGARYLKAHAYDIAIQVIFPSARELLKAGHAGSGSDLALFLIDVYIAKEQQVDATSRGGFPARSRGAQPRLRVADIAHAFYVIKDNLTQLIALTGPAGVWRKTVIDKAVAWAALSITYALIRGSSFASVGPRSTGITLLGILSFSNILGSYCTKVNQCLGASFAWHLS